MSFLASAGAKLLGAAGGALVGKLFGGGDADAQGRLGNLSVQMVKPRVMGFTSPGTRATVKGDTFNVRGTNKRQLAVNNLVKTNLLAGNKYRKTAAQVKPGFGKLTRSAREIIGNRRRAAVGDLKETFARRRISGSSFAADAVGRMESEFAQLERQAVAEAFVQELSMTTDLIGKEAEARSQAYAAQISNFAFDAEIGVRLATNGSQVMSAMAAQQAQMYNEMAQRGYDASVFNADKGEALAAPLVGATRDGITAGVNALLEKYGWGGASAGGEGAWTRGASEGGGFGNWGP